MNFRLSLLPSILLLSATFAFCQNDSPAKELKVIGNLSFEPIVESSGLVKSKVWENTMWTLNDSGDVPRIFPVTKTGKIIIPDWIGSKYEGIMIPDACNIDWEGITTDHKGNLYIAGTGNNGNARRDLAIYLLREPNPFSQNASRTFHTYAFEWPDQTGFPGEVLNFDCEAIFHANEKVYLLTKHRSDTHTKLYRFDSLDPINLNIPTLVDETEVGGLVTGADVSNDETRLAVLTYTGIWVFETSSPGTDDYFNGTKYWLPIGANTKGAEAIAFWEDDTLIITNEQRDIFEVKLAEMEKLKE